MPEPRPNVLIIHTDQQSWWTLGCYGGTVVDTPNIDRLAAHGVRFNQFFTNSAVCTPSRGCFVIGRYPEHRGAYTDNIPLHHFKHARAGIFTPEFESALVEDGDSILFDRNNDPDQTRNPFENPDYADVRTTLTKRVVEHHRELATPAAKWLALY